MKKLIIAGALAFAGLLSAQTTKGNWVLSGKTELSFNSTNTKLEYDGNELADSKISKFTVSPSVGYFVIDNLAVGVGLNFTSTKSDDTTENIFAVIPQATYYFPVAGQFRPFLEAGIGYGAANVSDDNSSEDFKMNGLAYGFGGGVAYFVNPNVAFNLGVNYSAANLKHTDSEFESKTGNLNVGIGISVFLK